MLSLLWQLCVRHNTCSPKRQWISAGVTRKRRTQIINNSWRPCDNDMWLLTHVLLRVKITLFTLLHKCAVWETNKPSCQIDFIVVKTLSYKLQRNNSNVVTSICMTRMTLMRSDMDHTVLPANNTIFAFTRKHSPGGATTHICIANAWVQLTTHLSTPRAWMDELAMLADIQRTVYPEEVTRQLHVMAQARKSSSVIDQRSNHCATPPKQLHHYQRSCKNVGLNDGRKDRPMPRVGIVNRLLSMPIIRHRSVSFIWLTPIW